MSRELLVSLTQKIPDWQRMSVIIANISNQITVCINPNLSGASQAKSSAPKECQDCCPPCHCGMSKRIVFVEI